MDDDRATLLGALLELAARLRDGDDDRSPDQLRAAWRHAGLRAFYEDREAEAEPRPALSMTTDQQAP